MRELGFPRIKGFKKRFKWKKMNFLTNLPKQKPQVTYLVATGKLGQSCYRMHIVYFDKNHPILCHMLRIQSHYKLGIGIPSRQHFKDNPQENLYCETVVKDQKSFKEDISESNRNKHPLEIEALRFLTAPFRNPFVDITNNTN